MFTLKSLHSIVAKKHLLFIIEMRIESERASQYRTYHIGRIKKKTEVEKVGRERELWVYRDGR